MNIQLGVTRQVYNLLQEPVEQPLWGFKIAEEKTKRDEQTDTTGKAFGTAWAKFEKVRKR